MTLTSAVGGARSEQPPVVYRDRSHCGWGL